MAQFTVYSSGDVSGPGVMFGSAGDLIRVLNAVLVVGYSGKAAAGWTHPVATVGNIASYKNASPANSGNGFGVVINDNGPHVTSTFKEAWATGWETVLGVGAPVGTGTGQFPTPALLLTSGHVVVRKSATADGTTPRSWVCYADSLTFYLFIQTGDGASYYSFFGFGDFFSLTGSSDQYRCHIQGRALENNATGGASTGAGDLIGTQSNTTANAVGSYAPRSWGGGGSCVATSYIGAIGLTAGTTNSYINNVGTNTAPNGPDNAYYIPPIWINELSASALRGRFRGLYHSAHPLATFADGQVISGAADYAGKTLQAVKRGISGGMWFVETSNTLETN